MPRQNKVIVDTAAMLPHAWAKPLGLTHHRQGTIVAIAPTKKALGEVLAAHGLAEYEIKSLLGGMRVWPHGNDTKVLLAAGGLSMDEPRILTYHRASNDTPVCEVRPDGSLVAIGHWEHDRTKTYLVRFVKEF